MLVSKIIKENSFKGIEIKGGYESEKLEYSIQEKISYEIFNENLATFFKTVSNAKSSIKSVLFIDEAQV